MYSFIIKQKEGTIMSNESNSTNINSNTDKENKMNPAKLCATDNPEMTSGLDFYVKIDEKAENEIYNKEEGKTLSVNVTVDDSQKPIQIKYPALEVGGSHELKDITITHKNGKGLTKEEINRGFVDVKKDDVLTISGMKWEQKENSANSNQ